MSQNETTQDQPARPAMQTCPFHDGIGERMARVEAALYGNPDDSRSTAVLPTIRRISTYLDALCWAWRALLLGLPAAMALVTAGRAMGWW